MLKGRTFRVAMLLLVFAGAAAVLTLVPLEDKATGTFEVRSLARAEVRAPMAAYLREVAAEEGDRVEAGAVVARLEIPDLASKAAQKKAEIAEAEAHLRLLRVGGRGARSGVAGAGGAGVDIASETQVRAAEIDAARATLQRLTEELRYLDERAQKWRAGAEIRKLVLDRRVLEEIRHSARQSIANLAIRSPGGDGNDFLSRAPGPGGCRLSVVPSRNARSHVTRICRCEMKWLVKQRVAGMPCGGRLHRAGHERGAAGPGSRYVRVPPSGTRHDGLPGLAGQSVKT
jgi:hypothetical protein